MRTQIVRKAEKPLSSKQTWRQALPAGTRKEAPELKGRVHNEGTLETVCASHNRPFKRRKQRLTGLKGQNQQTRKFSWRC